MAPMWNSFSWAMPVVLLSLVCFNGTLRRESYDEDEGMETVDARLDTHGKVAKAKEDERSRDVEEFQTESINLALAPQAISYNTFIEGIGDNGVGVFDPHAVEGVEVRGAANEYVIVGKGTETDGGANTDGFAARVFGSGGNADWKWRSNAAGMDVANSVVQLPDNNGDGDFLVVGYRMVNQQAFRSLTKLRKDDGAERWSYTFAENINQHGAWETISLSADGNSLYLGGLTKKPNTDEMMFKSYGNTEEGSACVMKIPVSAVTTNTHPVINPVWTKEISTAHTVKTVRELDSASSASNDVVVLMWTAELQTSLMRLSSSDGSTVWGKIDYPKATTFGEGTDMQVVPKSRRGDLGNSAVAVFGQGSLTNGITNGKGYNGHLMLVDAENGTHLWTKEFRAVPTTALRIYHECWGGYITSNGSFNIGCGVGIENCDELSGAELATCQAGGGDNRPGAVKRGPSVWRSMLVSIDRTGANIEWLRVDQWKAPGQPASPDHSSACEWIMPRADGGMTLLNDETSGLGLLELS